MPFPAWPGTLTRIAKARAEAEQEYKESPEWFKQDGGRRWSYDLVYSQRSVVADRYVSVLRDAMSADGLEPEGIYFGTTSGELYASLDRGEKWQRLPGHYSRILNVKTWIIES